MSQEKRDTTPIDAVIAEIVKRLVDAYRPERVYLFGSRARGDAGPDSDYDFLVVVPDDAPPQCLRAGRAYEVLWSTGAPAEIVVFSRERFDSRLSLKSSLPATAVREGRLLYAA